MRIRRRLERVGAALDRGLPAWLSVPLLLTAVVGLLLASLGLHPGPIAANPDADQRFLRGLERGFQDGWFMAWMRDPDKLDEVLDLEAVQGFVRRSLRKPWAAEGNLICAAYQLGMEPEDLPGWRRGQDWRYFWRHDPRPFSAYFLFGGGQPSARELNSFAEASRKQAIALTQRGVPTAWDDRYGLMIALLGLRMTEAWPDPDIAPRLEAWGQSAPSTSHPWDPFVDAQLCAVGRLNCDHEALRAFVEDAWDGSGFPNDGCGTDHCATKLLLNAVQLHYQLDWPLEAERCEGYVAGLVALQNPDGSFRADLDDPQRSDDDATIGLYHCGSFCQLHLWEILSSLNFLMSRCEVDPEGVARRVAELRSGRHP